MSDHLRTLSVTLEDLKQLASEQRLYVILDACNAPVIQEKVGELGSSRALCLYRGEVSPEILAVAPYVIQVDEVLLQWLVEKVWNEPWGIFIVAELAPEAVKKHLRKFLIVKGPEGEALYFRYYDPQVLSVFLESCNRQELNTFFGPFAALGYTVEAEPKRVALFQRL